MKQFSNHSFYSIFIFIIVVVLVVNFSETKQNLICSGTITKEGVSEDSTIYLELSDYRPWVKLWNDSEGYINLEIPNEWVEYYSYIKREGHQLQIYETYPEKTLKGNLSTLSKSLSIDLGSPFGFFEGSCSAN